MGDSVTGKTGRFEGSGVDPVVMKIRHEKCETNKLLVLNQLIPMKEKLRENFREWRIANTTIAKVLLTSLAVYFVIHLCPLLVLVSLAVLTCLCALPRNSTLGTVYAPMGSPAR